MRSLTLADAVLSLRSATVAPRSRVCPHRPRPAAATVAVEAGPAGAGELRGVLVAEVVRAVEGAGVPTLAARRMDATKGPV
jgi:hypothetical protein